MGSIPLPALNVQTQQAEDPMQSYAKMLTLRNLKTQQASEQLKLQQQQQALADQKAMTTAMQQWDGKNIEELPSMILKNGGSANAVFGVKQHILQQKDTLSQIAQRDATTGEKNLDTMLKKNDLMAGHIDSILQAPDAELPTRIMQAAQQGSQDGTFDQQHIQMAQQLAQQALQNPAQARQALQMMQKGILSETQMAAKAKADFEAQQRPVQAATAQAGLQTAQAEATIKGKEAEAAQLYGGLSPQMQESKYRAILQQVQQKIPVNPQDMAWARAYEASQRKSSTQSDSLGVVSNTTSGPAGLAAAGANSGGALRPASPQSAKNDTVSMIGEYRMDPALMNRMLFRHPEMLGLIRQQFPDWDQTTYNAKNKLIQGYTSGPQSKEINAINTVAGHLSVMDNAVQALNNGDVQVLNKLANSVGAQVGQTPQTTFQTIVHRIGPEITSAYIPGAGGEAERFANAKDFSENLSPAQLHANAAVTVQLLRSKIGALENQYKQAVGRDDFQQRFITPEANAAFQKLAPKAKTGGSGSGGFWSNVPGAVPHQ